ncbi:hypothetical protein SK128_022004 [Halocaridina rubra]|uniref:Coilin n=1 Tax=Halocaridina rubra TaxID=373956 RepID=A0AAN8XDI0_HALRR
MRIKVDFSEFFDDERKQAVVNVNTEETATVHDVLCKIIRMFNLSTYKRSSEGTSSKEKLALGLFEEGFYIHPSETSTVLQDIGILKLKALANVKEGNADGKKKKRKKLDDGSHDEDTFYESSRHKKNKTDVVTDTRVRKSQREYSEETDDGEEEEDENVVKKHSRRKKDNEENMQLRKIHRNAADTSSEDDGDDSRERIHKKKVCKKSKILVQKNERSLQGIEVRQKMEMTKAHNEEEDLGVLQKTRKSTRKGVIMLDNGSTQEERNVKKSPSKRDKEEIKECAYVVATEQKMEKKKKGKVREIYDEVNKKNATQSEKKSRVKLQESEDDDAGDITKESLERDRHHTEGSIREEVEVKTKKGLEEMPDEFPDNVDSVMLVTNDRVKYKNKKHTDEDITVSKELKNKAILAKQNKPKRNIRLTYDSPVHKEQLKSTSQEKEVSTSNIIHMNSEDDSEGSSTPISEGNNTPNQGEIKIIEADSLSSCIRESVLRRARRKRKHNKGKKRPPENEVECIPLPSQGNSFRRQLENHRSKLGWVSTGSQGSHIVFNSDDDEVTSVGDTCNQENDIEIVGTTRRSGRRLHQNEGSQPEHSGLFPTSKYRHAVMSEFWNPHCCTPIHCGYSTNHISQISTLRSRITLDSFTNLQRMVENKTITVVSIRSGTSATSTRQVHLPEDIPSLRRGPPEPVVQNSNLLNEDTGKIFYEILALKNRTVPLVLRTPKEVFASNVEVSSDEFSDKGNDSDICEVESTIPASVSLKMAAEIDEANQRDTNEECCDLSVPSTSGYTEIVHSPINKYVSQPKNNRRSVPKSFQAVGSLLSNLRQKDVDGSVVLDIPEVSNNTEELQTIHSSSDDGDGEDREIDKEDKNTENKPDTVVTSTLEENEVEVVANKDVNIVNDKEKSSNVGHVEASSSIAETDLLSGEAESKRLMEELLRETLKEDLTRDLKGNNAAEPDIAFQTYPLMKTLPKVGEFVAIKVLGLDEKLRPVYSRYIATRILKVVELMVTFKIIGTVYIMCFCSFG